MIDNVRVAAERPDALRTLELVLEHSISRDA